MTMESLVCLKVKQISEKIYGFEISWYMEIESVKTTSILNENTEVDSTM